MKETNGSTEGTQTPITTSVYANGHANGSTQQDASPASVENGVDDQYIREAIDSAAPNPLRMALYQLTGDPELAAMKISKVPIRGGALFDYVLENEDVDRVRTKAFNYLLDYFRKARGLPPPPSISEARKLMNLFGGTMIGDNDVQPGYEELGFDEFPRGVEWSSTSPDPSKLSAYKVVVIGAGLSGIAAAIQLKRLGIPFQVIERQEGLGGTWLLNDYPGCRVDTLSYLFQYRFEKNYKWKDWFASRPETQDYLHHVAEKYHIAQDFQYGKEVLEATWDQTSSTWNLVVHDRKTDTREHIKANAIVSAQGLFSTPNDLPDIPGLKNFKGAIFHTAKWDYNASFNGRRVALIGTGSTGTQLSGIVANQAAKLTVYQRSPNWITHIDGYMNAVPDHMHWLCDKFPYYWNWYCYAAYFRSLDLAPLQVIDKKFEAKGKKVNERNESLRENLTSWVKEKMSDRPDLIPKLIPTIAPLVRRLVVDNGFYDTLKRDNVELITTGIDKITETGILTTDGLHEEFDMIVLGSGFKTSKYFYPTEYIGRNGATLDDLFAKDGARSYLGMVMPGFPNLFTLYGPNHQPRGGSLYSWAEIWARYAVNSIAFMIENDIKDMEVRKVAFDEYQQELDEAASKLIWESEGISSYYVNEHGRSGVNMPWTTSEYHARVIKPDPADFVLTRSG